MVMEEQQTDMELDSERVPVPQVQKTGENSHVETVNNMTSVSRGKPRLRKKALHAAILKQMEFYFSDANLNKDRFLSGLIKDDPYVDLNIFIRFNKIRELTTDINRINKAIQSSVILSTSEDGTKVRRVTPIVMKENTDECTVYVQNLPPDADHEMLSAIFAQYGSVEYVSVPKYKQTKKIKGFAFVEFDTPESAAKCLKAFQKKGCVLPSHSAPDKLLSITTFDDAEKDVTMQGRQTKSNENKRCLEDDVNMDESECGEADEDKTLESNEGNETLNCSLELQENKDQKKVKKRKHQTTESSEAVEAENETDNEVTTAKKKFKHSTDVQSDEIEQNNEAHSDVPVDNVSKKSSKRKKSMSISKELNNSTENEQVATEDSMIATADEQEDINEKKKKRKRKRRSKTEDISVSMGLQVMAKKEWKHLRNKYLELQRSKMKQLKQHLRKTRWNQWSNYEKNKPEKEEANEKEKTNKQDNTTTSCRFSFTPGVIVKIEMDKPCSDPKGFKMELKSNNLVKYIDVSEGSFIAFVRCDTTEGAQTFAQKSDEERHMTILEGKEERDYWDKISHDREEKLGKKIRPKQRGRTKLLKKAEKELGKHIKFDEV
ncbi:la related protein 7 [Lasioglossum baleicum]|uniref:la related protein 7 n=1 Tax=Lasioglossum baleicum TaxID=434251 RepID=UPI003FCE4375